MNSKRVRHTETMTGQTPADIPETGQAADSNDQPMEEVPSTLEDLQKQLAELQAQADEYKDGWQRSVADFQNYRRRVKGPRPTRQLLAVSSNGICLFWTIWSAPWQLVPLTWPGWMAFN